MGWAFAGLLLTAVQLCASQGGFTAPSWANGGAAGLGNFGNAPSLFPNAVAKITGQLVKNACTGVAIPAGNSTSFKKKIYSTLRASSLADCLRLCAKHTFCVSAGYQPGSGQNLGQCMFSYYTSQCGTPASIDTTTEPSGSVMYTCLSPSCEESAQLQAAPTNIPTKPNILFMLGDDFGLGDLASFGNPLQEWGPMDDMALNGIRFKSWYAGDSLCSPARVAIQTGRFPARVGCTNTKDYLQRVYLPTNVIGIPWDAVTIAEMLQTAGYKTGMCGKWHMGINANTGDDCAYCPQSQGYDFFQIWMPFSNAYQCDSSGVFMPDGPRWDYCFLYNNTKNIMQPIDKENLTFMLVDSFNNFLNWAGSNPWYFYFSWPQIHIDIYRNHRFVNSSLRGRLGDNLNEMNWGVGQIWQFLIDRQIDDNTFVMFTVDHGAHIELCNAGGHNAGMQGGKSYSWEGGFRIPAFAYWPGVIRGGQMSWAVLTSMDLYPTFAKLAGATMPTNQTFDGEENLNAILGFTYQTRADRPVYYHCGDQLHAMRYKDYKFHYATHALPTSDEYAKNCPGGTPTSDWFANDASNYCQGAKVLYHDPPLIFNMIVDPWEQWPVNTTTTPGLQQIMAEAEAARQAIISSFKTNPPAILPLLNAEIYPCCAKTPNVVPGSCSCNYPGKFVGPPSGQKPLG